jgi:hypothetical protein
MVEFVGGPFKFDDDVPAAFRFSQDSRKLAVSLYDPKGCDLKGQLLQVWDIQAQKLDVERPSSQRCGVKLSDLVRTTKDRSIIATFNSMDDKPKMISKFDASTLKLVGAPFKHTSPIYGLVLSFDCVLLASSSDRTIKPMGL